MKISLLAMLPPLPAWHESHPIVVHFPIALLAAVPALVLLAMAWRAHRRGVLAATLVVMALGVLGAILATATGEAGEDAARGVPGAPAILHEHEEQAELARNIFIALGLVLAAGTAAVWRWAIGPRGGSWSSGWAFIYCCTRPGWWCWQTPRTRAAGWCTSLAYGPGPGATRRLLRRRQISTSRMPTRKDLASLLAEVRASN